MEVFSTAFYRAVHLFGDKHLGPVVAAGYIAHADVGIGCIQDIGAMTGGIHPAIYNCLGCCVALGDILAGAVGHNPISIIIPCHRVVGANESLTGYAGGVDKKIRLLTLEGVDTNKFFLPK